MASGPDSRAYLFALAPMLVVVAVAPALALLPSPFDFEIGMARFFGVPVVAAGVGVSVWAVDAFARAGATPSPAEKPDRLVTQGPLRYTRNPIYLGTVVAALGVGVLLESVVVVAYAALLWAVYHFLTVYKEEPELRDEMGDEYAEYCENVPRWI